MAVAYPSGIYVTARVRANDIGEVRPAAPVDIEADAVPDVTMTGVVSRIQVATAGRFSVYPGPDQNLQNPQPLAEYVPVRIALTRTGGLALTPGMNVTVHIRRDPSA